MGWGEKTGGRKPGSQNKVNKATREHLEQIMERHVDSLPDLIDSIEDPVDKVTAIEKIMSYFRPKLKAIELTNDNNNPIIINFGTLSADQLRELISATTETSDQLTSEEGTLQD
jgi:hypothetical protein